MHSPNARTKGSQTIPEYAMNSSLSILAHDGLIYVASPNSCYEKLEHTAEQRGEYSISQPAMSLAFGTLGSQLTGLVV